MFINMLENLSSILKKAERHAEKRKIDKDIFINARLIADMRPLTSQIQIGTDMIRLGVGRLANVKHHPTKIMKKHFLIYKEE
jgi:hypothetical protein